MSAIRISLLALAFPPVLAADPPAKPAAAMRDGLPPAEAVANFTLPEGFRIELVAAEPDVRQPVAMTLDVRGRLWIAEAYNYPNRAEGDSGGDRILIFEDTDGDGSFETRKVFLENLNLVSGLEVGFGGVWIGAAPYLLFVPDADGDDVPDGKPQRLLDGWGWQDTHETLNSFIWGPDGWLYGCHGVFTHSRVGKPGTPDEAREPINAGVWRFHPRTHEFEVVAHGTSNPWGLDFNDHGEAFVTACVIPHLYHIIPGARYQRQAGQHFDPHTYDDIKTIADHLHYDGNNPWESSRAGTASDFGGGHAHCGLSIYLGDNFPPHYRNALLFNNLHGHRMNHDVADRSGSGYVGKHRPDFLFGNDEQHMGVALRYGPDGGIFLIDWYDAQTCHHTLQEAWDRSNGRIYKISHGEPEPRRVDLAKLSDLELARLQLHPNDWFVRTARRVLQERHLADRALASDAEAELRSMLRHADETRRLRALWALHVTGLLKEETLVEILKNDPNEHVRAWALRLGHEKRPSPEFIAAAAAAADGEESPLVRLHHAAALQRIPLEQRAATATKLLARADDADDPNLPLMLWYAVGDFASERPDEAVALAAASRIPLVRRFLVRRLFGSPDGQERVLAALAEQSDDPDFAAEALAGMGEALAEARNLPAPATWEAAAAILEKLPGDESRRTFERIATVFGDARMTGRFRETLLDAAAPREDRLAAFDNLRRLRDPDLPVDLLAAATRGDEPMRVDWLQALGTVESGEAAQAVVTRELRRLLPDLAGPAKQAAVQTLAASEAGAMSLAEALAAAEIARTDVGAFVARQLRSYDNPAIDRILEAHWGAIADSGKDKSSAMARYAKELTPEVLAGADLRRGRELYRATCHACHVLFGDGNALGPDLTGSNRADLRYLLENLVDPGAVVGLDYQLHVIRTRDGRTLAGLLRGRSGTALTLGMVGGPETVVPLDEIEDHQVSTTSLMPEGLLENLTETEVRDLVAYLQSPRQVPLPSPHEILVDDERLEIAEVTAGQVRPQDMHAFDGGTWTSDRQLWWTGGKTGDRLELQFDVPESGRYEVFAAFTMAHDYATIDASLNGRTVAEGLDLFHKPAVVTTGDLPLGVHRLDAGRQTLTLEITGANEDATPLHMVGLDHLRILPAE